jgi:hypothetical protein
LLFISRSSDVVSVVLQSHYSQSWNDVQKAISQLRDKQKLSAIQGFDYSLLYS